MTNKIVMLQKAITRIIKKRSLHFFLVSMLVACQQVYAYDLKAIANLHILPAYERLEKNTNVLASAAKNYCAMQDDAKLATLGIAYTNAFTAWQSIQHIRFGPIQYSSREYRMQLWPDERGIVSKQLKKLKQDVSQLNDAFDISKQSVALQGFSALEILVYKKSQIDQHDCFLIVAISENLNSMARNLVKDWSSGHNSYVDHFANPGSANSIYNIEKEVIAELLNGLNTQLWLIVSRKLQLPLGSDIEKARGKLAEARRSNNSLNSIQANLKGCLDLYNQAFAPQVTDKDLNQRIQSAFDKAQALILKIKLPLEDAVEDRKQRKIVEKLKIEINAIKVLIAQELTRAIDVPLGFNSLDGD